MKNVTPFLMFQGGVAEEAMNYYTSLIEDSEIKSITRYGAEDWSRRYGCTSCILIKGAGVHVYRQPC